VVRFRVEPGTQGETVEGVVITLEKEEVRSER